MGTDALSKPWESSCGKTSGGDPNRGNLFLVDAGLAIDKGKIYQYVCYDGVITQQNK